MYVGSCENYGELSQVATDSFTLVYLDGSGQIVRRGLNVRDYTAPIASGVSAYLNRVVTDPYTVVVFRSKGFGSRKVVIDDFVTTVLPPGQTPSPAAETADRFFLALTEDPRARARYLEFLIITRTAMTAQAASRVIPIPPTVRQGGVTEPRHAVVVR